VLYSKESKSYTSLEPGDVVTLEATGWCRKRHPDDAIIWTDYWPDVNHDRANWKTRYQPNHESRPTLFTHKVWNFRKENPNYVFNTEATMQFCKNEFGRGLDKSLDIGYSVQTI
jgi:hypothetical protein